MADARDKSIYLLCWSYDPDAMFWYVIEEKGYDDQDMSEISSEKFTEQGRIKVLRESERERIRSLRLPSLSPPLHKTNLVVCNSRFFLLGGCKYAGDRKSLPLKDVVFLDSKLHSQMGWQAGSCFESPKKFVQAAVCKSGSILVLDENPNCRQPALWLSSLSCGWQELPEPPKGHRFDFGGAQVLAVTDTKIFCRVRDEEKTKVFGVCFNLEKWAWQVFDEMSFKGSWCQGAVLFGSHLFLYGTQYPDQRNADSLRAYDLKWRRWLPDPVSGLDGKVIGPSPSSYYDFSVPYLFQVRDNAMAFVWQNPHSDFQNVRYSVEIHWTKFTIHRDCSSRSPDGPLFHAEVLSRGACLVEGLLHNCTAQVIVREEGEKISGKRKLLEKKDAK